MADIDLLGYGPHTLAASNDYHVKCVGGGPKRRRKLIVGINRTAGTIQPKSKLEGAGSAFSLESQEYTKADGTEASSALSADATIEIDATGKQVVLTTDASFEGSVQFAVEREQ